MGEKIYTPQVLTPDEIIARLPIVFEEGVGGELFYYESTTKTYSEDGIEYEIRECPALRDKPVKPIPSSSSNLPKSKSDPFESPYSKDLLIGELHGEDNSKYIVMLNKYSIAKHHFLLITKEFVPQTTPPTPGDLMTVYSLITSAYRGGMPFFAFFNCGDNSGASQPHKHLQLYPVLSNYGPPLEALAKRANPEAESKPFSLPDVPWAHFVRRFPPHLSAQSTPKEEVYGILAQAFMTLLDLAITAIRYDKENNHGPGTPHYNLIITQSHMHIIPRSQQKHILTDSGVTISVNGAGFAGYLLVKSDAESEAVMKEGVRNILRRVAVPMIDDELLHEPHAYDQGNKE